MIFNKQKRIQYLGFNDLYFMIIGIIILSFITDYLFNNSFARYELLEALINYSISLMFTITNWLLMRSVLIFLRRKFPGVQNAGKRVVLVFSLVVISVFAIDFLGTYAMCYFAGEDYHPIERSRVVVPIIIISIMVQAIYMATYHYIHLKQSIRKEEQTKQAIVQAQLDALRNQAQPHFLFNTLNTLRDIIDQNSKSEAKAFVDKIADVYRFILVNSNTNLIPLQEEVKFTQSYLHIQQERFGSNLMVNWNLGAAVEGLMVVPMSLQLLLENAIKHNVISASKPLIVDIDLTGERLIVSNPKQLKSTKLPSTGIGLNNIIQRYGLITDQDVHINDKAGYFRVSLPVLHSTNQLVQV